MSLYKVQGEYGETGSRKFLVREIICGGCIFSNIHQAFDSSSREYYERKIYTGRTSRLNRNIEKAKICQKIVEISK